MKIDIDDVEYGLKLFHKLKYSNGVYKYSEIPKIVDVAFKIQLWLNHLQEAKKIESDFFLKINGLLEQYFRTEFLKYSDRNSINEYLESKSYFPYDDEINWRFLHTEKYKANDYYIKWLGNQNLQIERLKKFKRYFELSENELMKNISYESYGNQKIYLFLKQYFILKLDFLFSNLHLEFLLGDIMILNKKETSPPPPTKPKSFKDLFYNPKDAEVCLDILRELQPPVIDNANNYIGKGKGIFPLWINVLKNYEPKPLIKHFRDLEYKDLLNEKIKGLNLTKDASEFRKSYVRLDKYNTKLDIKTILSQYSQEGKLGK